MNILKRDVVLFHDTKDDNQNVCSVLYQNFLKQIWSFFQQAVSDVRQWRYIVERMYPLYKSFTLLPINHPHYISWIN